MTQYKTNGSYKDITAGELGNNNKNSPVLKELFNIKIKKENLSDLIINLDIKIKTPRFE